jgi:hypothetical protein
MGDYFMSTLSQFRDDTVVVNPLNIAARAEEVATTAGTVVAAAVAPPTELPIGHSAIVEHAVYFDTLTRSFAYQGFQNGSVMFQLNDFNNQSQISRAVQVTILPFIFPYINQAPFNTPNYWPNPVFGAFYIPRAYLWLRFLPVENQAPSAAGGIFFTFELAVEIIDSSFVRMIPLNPTVTLSKPVNIAGELEFKFFNRNPVLGITEMPVPATRIIVEYVAIFMAPDKIRYRTILQTNNFALTYLSTAQVLVSFIQRESGPPSTLDMVMGQTLFVSNFTVVPGLVGLEVNLTFDVLVTIVPPAFLATPPRFIIEIPKNGFGIHTTFSCVSPDRTNDLVPTY